MYTGRSGPTLINYEAPEREKEFIDEYVRVERIATDIDNVKRRTEDLALKWEVTKTRALIKGARFYRCEDEYLEHGGPLAWDEFNDYLMGGADLRPRFAAHVTSRYDDNTMRGAA